ncbi:MAG: hypothetical protein V4622_07840 [Bacteroidota bacterium]
MKKLVLTLLLFFLSLSQEIFAQGCSQCKLLAEQGAEMDEASFGTNINSGILYLMIIPYILLLLLFRKKIIGVLKMVFMKRK